jgi:ABC-type lipoprotein release transport system permease subunit
MWEFLMGYFFARATGVSRYVRPVLALLAIGVVVAGLIYTYVVFNAVNERSHTPHGHAHSIH